MKTFLRTLALLLVVFFSSIELNAQRMNYKTDSGFDIGFGIGGSYQQSDIKNSVGGGFDFTFGHSIYQREKAFFSLDWRFRFLAGANRAFDHRINDDGTYNNIRYSHFNYDLEFALTLNRLRNRTGIILSGFAGFGLAHSRTWKDLENDDSGFFGGPAYDYSVINTSGNDSQEQIYQDLVELSDGEFETKGINHASITPTLGFYVGYQFTPRFSMGIEHKTNYFLNESNNIIGANIDGIVSGGSGIDRNHYTALAFKWDIGRVSGGGTVTTNTNTTTSFTEPRPTVDIYDPNVNPYNTTIYTHTIRAKVTNVKGYSDIAFYQDGNRNVNFTYNVNTKDFEAHVIMHDNANVFRIVASNTAGSAEDNTTIIVTRPIVQLPPPIVDITVPNSNPYTSSASVVDISSQVLNVRTKEDIQVIFNGYATGFEYFASSNNVRTTLNLVEGNNTLVITGVNEVGADSDDLTIIYNKPIQPTPPVVKITTPASAPANVQSPEYVVVAQTLNVRSKQDATVKINGAFTNYFTFNSNGVITTNVILNEGANVVEITGRNEYGTASDVTTIIYTKPAVILPPVVTILIPEVSPYTTYESSEDVTATVLNVKGKEFITVTINGINTTNFTYNTSNRVLKTTVALKEGHNVVTITGRNEVGQDSKSQVIIKETKPCPLPTVSLIQPTQNPLVTSNQAHTIVLSTTNAKNVSVKYQGENYSNFQFNSASGQIVIMLDIAKTKNLVDVYVSNECGTATKHVELDYKAVETTPCYAPTILLVSPSNETQETTQYSYSAQVNNIDKKSQLTFTVNGRITDFTFNNKIVSYNATLLPGANTFTLVATNECGVDSKTATITYVPVVEEPCFTPVVNFTVTEVNRADASHELAGSVTNVKNKSDITLTVNGAPDNGFQYVPSTNALSTKFKLKPGTYTIIVTAKNECGEDSKTITVNVKEPEVEEPCLAPVVNFTVIDVNRSDASHELKGTVANIKNKTDITLTVDGKADNGFQFVPSTMELTTKFKLTPGTHTIIVTAKNECGEDSKSFTVTVAEPCVPPVVNFTVTEVNRADASHELAGSVTNVKNKSDITLTVNGAPDNGFQYVPSTNALSTKFKLKPGTYTIIVTAKNECGEDSKSFTVTIAEPEIEEEKACGPRINPGNSEWQFCLVTPSGIYNRDNLASNGFTYSGPASSLFILPIAGGGDAIVNGQPYAIKSGQYYLFNGNMTVTVSTSNPGSMGHWSVCIDTDKAPTFGNGGSRPKSPCEAENENGNGGSGGSSGGQGGGNGSGNKGGQGGGNNNENRGGNGENSSSSSQSQQEEAQRKKEEEAARQRDVEEQAKKEAEAKQRAADEERKKQEDAARQREAAEKAKIEAEARQRAAEEQKRKAEEQKKAAEEAKRKADEAKARAEENRKRQEEARRKAEEEKEKQLENNPPPAKNPEKEEEKKPASQQQTKPKESDTTKSPKTTRTPR